jgi:hypothetical protein
MAPYKLLQEQFVALALFGGVVLVTFLFVAFNAIRFVSKKQIKAEHTENYVDGIKSTDKPVPVFLIILYIAYFLWAIIYVGAVALWGFNF